MFQPGPGRGPCRRSLIVQLSLAILLFQAGVLAALPIPDLLALSGERVEVSDDGHLAVAVAPDPGDGRGWATEGGSAIYPTEPDWGNDFRLQVGGLQVADMDGDGWRDVVLGCYQSNSFPPYKDWHNFIYFNLGGTLEASPSWTSNDDESTGDLQVADVNGDGFLDVLAGNGGFSMAPSVIYFGTDGGPPSTTAGWVESGGATWTNYLLPFDVDHDGDLDLFTANQGNSQTDPFRPMRMFENDEGTLATTPVWQSDETSIQNFLAFGDLDDDGWEDLAVSKWINFESGVYANQAGTLATVPTWTTGDDGDDKGVAWADVDANGDPNLALGHDPTQLFANVEGILSLDWSASGSFFGHSEIRFEDVDLDGDQDLAEIHFANGVVNLYLNQGGALETTPSWSYNSVGVGTALAFGDLDGDGLPDLVVGNSGDVSVMVFFNRLDNPSLLFTDGFESGDTSAWTTPSEELGP